MTLTELSNLLITNLTRVGSNFITGPEILQSCQAIVSYFATQIANIIPDWTSALNFNMDGTGAGAYCKFPDDDGVKRLFESKTNGNINHTPPSDPTVHENTYWKEVSASESAAIPEWSVGIYGPGLIIVFHNHSVDGRGLYVLLEPVRPYSSTDIEAEITAGKWEVLTGGSFGGGTVTTVGALSPLFTVSNATTTPTFTAINQNANLIYAGPSSGGAAAPTFRSLVSDDIPNLDASKITTGVLNIAQIPAAALERVYVYAGAATLPENAGLTTANVQNGDVVKMTSTGLMYIVTNDAALSSAGSYQAYAAGTAATVPWSGVTGTPTSLSGYGIIDAWKITGTTTLTGAVEVAGNTANTIKFTCPAIGVTPVIGAGLWLQNPTAAVNAAVQYSPSIVLEGNAYNTTVAASQSVQWMIDVVPQQGGPAITSTLRIRSANNGGTLFSALNIIQSPSNSVALNFAGTQIYPSTATDAIVLNAATGAITVGLKFQGLSGGAYAVTSGSGAYAFLNYTNGWATNSNSLSGAIYRQHYNNPGFNLSGGSSTITIIGYDWAPTLTSMAGVSAHIAWRNTSGVMLVNGTTVTANTILDVRGSGTSTNTILRLADSANVLRFSVLDNGSTGLYGVSPVARATTAGAASTFAANTSLIANDTATWDSYTIGQVVKALRNIGILT